MPDQSPTKHTAHPNKSLLDEDHPPLVFADDPYAEICVTTNFTFLTGASHPEQLVRRAAELGYRGIAVTDRNSLAGAVRMHVAAKEIGLPLAIGCHLTLQLLNFAETVSDTVFPVGADPVEYSIAALDQTWKYHPGEASGQFPKELTGEQYSNVSSESQLHLLVYPTTRAAYGRLCQLLTRGKLRAPKGECYLLLSDLLDYHEELLAVILPPDQITKPFIASVLKLKQTFTPDRLSIAVSCIYGADDRSQLNRVVTLAGQLGIEMVATNEVQYHVPECKPLHDVLACIREGVSLDNAGFILKPNAEQHLKTPREMHRLFENHPDALRRGVAIIEQASQFSLDELRYEYPSETCPSDKTPMEHLTELTMKGAKERYNGDVPDKVRQRLEHELNLIEELNYPHYFLTVHDIVDFARSQDILCQGRGAAANSAVCYCLGVTAVDPNIHQLLFERFVSKERDEPPDIDIDFEHERREEVIQHLYEKYRRDRAALTAEVITYRSRSAIRDVGKALGLSLDLVDRLAKDVFWFDKDVSDRKRFEETGIDPNDPTIERLGELCRQILGFPRHLSQHVGGFVLTENPLCETVPIENAAMPNRTVIEWDKDDIDALGMMKVDVLGLGMLTCVRKCFELVEQYTGKRYTMATLPQEDPVVYDMICEADTIGVFQVESRAQMSMLPRLRPRKFYDLVIEVAIVRPGPIQGNMVHPYLRRRSKEEDVTYPKPEIKDVLERTLGVPLFQEQAMALSIKAAGFTPGEADQLRRSMAAWKRKGHLIKRFEQKIINGMLANGYEREFAERCFNQIKGFGDYGFPESHAASFALIVYVSAWLKRHHPAAFAAALINSQPMGFYAPSQIVRDAREHDVTVYPIDVNHSQWDCTIEPVHELHKNGVGYRSLPSSRDLSDGRSEDPGQQLPSTTNALRLGMRLMKGLKEEHAHQIACAVNRHGPFDDIESLWCASSVPVKALHRLALADAFGSMGLDRQHALWQIGKLRDERLPLFENENENGVRPRSDSGETEDTSYLPHVSDPYKVLYDYSSVGLSLKSHPLAFLRPRLNEMRAICNKDLSDPLKCPNGKRVSVPGMILVRQRPGTASGIVFVTIEDETGVANLIVRPKVFLRYRRVLLHSKIILAHGTVERDSTTGRVVHVMVRSVENIGKSESQYRLRQRNFH